VDPSVDGDGVVIMLFIHSLHKKEPFIAEITLNGSIDLHNKVGIDKK